MIKPPVYTRTEYRRAVNLSAVAGWAAIHALYLLDPGHKAEMGFVLLYLGFFGLVTAFIIAWLTLGPILWLAMKQPIGWLRAMFLGGGVLATLGAIFRAMITKASAAEVVSFAIHSAILGAAIAGVVRTVIGPGKDNKSENNRS